MASVAPVRLRTTEPDEHGGRRRLGSRLAAIRRGRSRESVAAYLLILPSLVGWGVFIAAPIVMVIYLSFDHWKLGGVPHFVGLANYLSIFSDPTLSHSILLTLYYTIITVPVLLSVGLLLALLMNVRSRFFNFIRVLYVVPWLSTPVIIGIIWQWMLFPNGLIASVLSKLDIVAPAWLSSQKWALPAIAAVTIWQYSGYNMLFYLAGLQGIPKELFEAMDLDGAGLWKQVRYLTLPMVRGTTLFVFIINVIASFTVFDLVYVMTAGGPGNSSSVLSFAAYVQAFTNFNEGLASALSVVLFVMTLCVVAIQFRYYRHRITYSRY